MKIKLLSLILITISISGFSQNNFLAPVTNDFGLTNHGDPRASVNFGDLDDDGDLDLISGSSGMGFFYYENIGSSTVPVYDNPINNPFNLITPSSGALFTPVFVDLDTDGDLDVVSGNNFGRFYYYENIGTASSPNYTDQIQGAFGLVEASFILSSPFFIDIDGDGDFDMFSGVFSESNGNFYYFQNTGTATVPSYEIPVQDPFNLGWSSGTASSGFSAPSFADFDNDGDFDLLAGSSSGNFYYYENIGTTSVPSFDSSIENPFNLEQSFIVTVPHAIDIDGDVDLDVMVGSNSGNFGFYKNELPMPMTSIPDPVFEQSLIDQGIDSIGILDGQVLTADIEVVTNLILVDDSELSDLTGLSDFISLQYLICYGNSGGLTSVDLSNLLDLIEINFDNTPIISGSLDISNNSNLENLYVSNTGLNSIDVSSNTNLINVNLRDNNIDSINVSNSPNLSYLEASNNNLSSIDITNNINLTQLYLSGNNLIDIDLFSNDLLQILDLSFNNIVNIDINQNINLTTLLLRDNALVRPFLANGNNTAITNCNMANNPELVCITVDDVAYADANFSKDATASFSTNCNDLWVVYTEDANFETAIETTPGVDVNGDGEVTYGEAQAFTGVIDLNNQEIFDVTGLEAFSNADTIDLSDNIIEDINTFLTSESFLIETRNASTLAQSIVFRRPKIRIRSLNVARNNLSEVDISRTEGMESLDVSGNDLTSLTLALGTAVNRFDDTSNNRSADNLITMIATDTGGLGCIQVDDVNDANNKVTSGDWLIDPGTIFNTNCAALLSTNDFSLDKSIVLSPNPSSINIELSFSNNVELDSVEIYNMVGKKVLSTNKDSISIENFQSGIYIIRILTNRGQVTKKLIKI